MAIITGIHHVTGAAVDPQTDYDFYTKVLGLRLIKRTVNHEDPRSWHLFYGDYEGNAGTVMTNFLFKGLPVPPYRRGRGSISEVSYSVPPGSLGYWRDRLADAGCTIEERPARFGQKVLYFEDPHHIPSEMIEAEDERDPKALHGVAEEAKLRGFHSLTLVPRIHELSLEFFTKILKFEIAEKEGNRTRLAMNGGGPGKWIDLVEVTEGPWYRFGLGAIHHFALTVPTLSDIRRLFLVLGGAGLIATDPRDRKWFHSMYFTEPGGINIEFSNVEPGFTVDEPVEHLGETLQLPEQWKDKRAEIEGRLPALNF